MEEKIITESSSEKITVRWDGTRFALTIEEATADFDISTAHVVKTVIILNPREMLDLVDFARAMEESIK